MHFVLFDRDATVPGVDTLYVADDRSPPTGGVQKWTFDGGTASDYLQCRATTGTRGLTGFVTGSDVTLVATAASATMFHGVALAPQ